MVKSLSTQITAVTVYTDQAMVTRCGELALEPDDRELEISGLPTTLRSDSLRVQGQSSQAVKILGVRTDRVFATEATAPKIADLEAQIKTLEEQKRELGDRKATVQLQQQFIQGLAQASVNRFATSLAKQETQLDETQALLQFLGQHYGVYGGTIAQLVQDQQKIDEELSVLRRRLKQWQQTRPQESFSVFVKVSTEQPCQLTLELIYQVNQARWKPLYDLQVETQTPLLTLDYLAEVQQNTGEDWHQVALTLSTAKPSLGTLPPKLQPWYINLASPNPPMVSGKVSGKMMAMRAKKSVARSPELEEDFAPTGAMALNAAAGAAPPEPPAPQAAQAVTAQVDRIGSVATFQVPGDSDIPGDGNGHTVTLFQDDYPGELVYGAMPSLVSFAYLQAKVLNPQDRVTLLPGRANIFRDGAFVGTTQLENVAPGQGFEVNLGIEEGIQLERDLVERQVDKKLLSLEDTRRITFAYRLKLKNLLGRSIQLKVTEQIPVSRNEQLKVRLVQTKPKVEMTEMGELVWQLDLASESHQEIYYQFGVEHPSGQRLTGLD
jgi:uncharacterized protein (TIGR02231 family)